MPDVDEGVLREIFELWWSKKFPGLAHNFAYREMMFDAWHEGYNYAMRENSYV